MMKKDELLSVFPTPVQIYKYENNIEKELKHIERLEWKEQPANGNFRSSDSYLTKQLKNKFKTKKKYICGLSWISKNDNIGVNKSVSLEILKPILLIKNIEFLDIQYNDTSCERDKFYKENGIKISKIESIDNFNDLNGLTSLIDICDFVITVSNTNAHISGALGKKTFLLLPKGKGRLWYWSSKKKKSICWFCS